MSLENLLQQVRACQICAESLPLGANPVVQAGKNARILIIGQAPGTKVHSTSIPWNDPSGDRLRQWLDIDKDEFYDPNKIAIVPMGFCYPGKGNSGDLPPRKECAPTWHKKNSRTAPQYRVDSAYWSVLSAVLPHQQAQNSHANRSAMARLGT